jgi:hypothetical protein
MGCTSSNSSSHKQQDFGKEEDFDFKPIHSAIRWNKPLPEIGEIVKNEIVDITFILKYTEYFFSRSATCKLSLGYKLY